MRRSAGLVVGLVVSTVFACSPPPSPGCTGIGSSSGINVTIVSEAAVGVTGLSLDVCADDRCRAIPVELSPGGDMVSLDCPTTVDDSSCSATFEPDGSLTGFADVADLTPGHVRVGATVTRNGKPQHLGPTTLDVTPTYPNGPQCPVSGNQATAEVTRVGIIG